MATQSSATTATAAHSTVHGKHGRLQHHHHRGEKLYHLFLVVLGLVVTLFLCIVTLTHTYDEGAPSKLQTHEMRLQDFKNLPSAKRSNATTIAQQQQNDDEHVSKQQQIHYSNEFVLQSQLPPLVKTSIPYHVIFSTSCSDQQNWESYVLFYHALKVGQPGNITRIVSGCENDRQMQRFVKDFHDRYIFQGLSDRFHIHFTPDFSKQRRADNYQKTVGYKYMNKPFGLFHWMEQGPLKLTKERLEDPNDPAGDGIVILMDPDMILLRPLLHDFTNDTSVVFAENSKDPPTRVVRHGYPMAQQDGYLQNQWKTLDYNYIINGKHNKSNGQSSRLPPNLDGPKNYNSGPPYLATVKDMYHIATKWTEYGPRVYEIHPKLFAEMYGYIFATIALDLPHTLIRSLVVSTTESTHREGWNFVDALEDTDICLWTADERSHQVVYPPPGHSSLHRPILPVVLHYCKRYFFDHWFFSKYRLKKRYISCTTRMLASPPHDLFIRATTDATTDISKAYPWTQPPPAGTKNFQNWKGETNFLSSRQAKREAFMLCAMISSVNEAARHYKRTACQNETVTMDESYTFFNDPDKY